MLGGGAVRARVRWAEISRYAQVFIDVGAVNRNFVQGGTE